MEYVFENTFSRYSNENHFWKIFLKIECEFENVFWYTRKNLSSSFLFLSRGSDFLNLGVLDLEMTCDGRQDGNKFIDDGRMKHYKREIISVGFVVFNDRYEIKQSYKTFVKPVKNAVLTDYCKNLTGISQTDVDNGKKCSDVFSEIFDICKKYCINIILTFGNFDKAAIINSARRYQKAKDQAKNLYIISAKILDMKPIIMKAAVKTKTKHEPGLSKIADSLGIKNDLPNHDALNDSVLLYKVCRRIKLRIRKTSSTQSKKISTQSKKNSTQSKKNSMQSKKNSTQSKKNSTQSKKIATQPKNF